MGVSIVSIENAAIYVKMKYLVEKRISGKQEEDDEKK